MTVAFTVLVLAGIVALLVATWLLVAADRRAIAASLLVGGFVALILAGVVAVVNHERNYQRCLDVAYEFNGGFYVDQTDSPESKCEDEQLFGGAFGY